jgi:hypothetical protein
MPRAGTEQHYIMASRLVFWEKKKLPSLITARVRGVSDMRYCEAKGSGDCVSDQEGVVECRIEDSRCTVKHSGCPLDRNYMASTEAEKGSPCLA